MQSGMADFVPGAATLRTGRNIDVVFDSGLFASLSENYVIQKIKVYNVLYCRQRRTEPRQQATCTKIC